MKKIFEMYGGSKAYGLATPESDTDVRFVFLNTDKAKIIGLDRYEHQDIKSAEEDTFGFELRHFLNLLRKTNTQVLELLFSDECLSTTSEWSRIRHHKFDLLDSERFFKSLLGYIQGERRLMMGERTGTLGGKRKAALDTYGYSYKNAVQLLRLTFCGRFFFQHGVFPVDITPFTERHAHLMGIKTNPGNFDPQDILEESLAEEEKLKAAFDNRTINYTFNADIANDLCRDLYYPLL